MGLFFNIWGVSGYFLKFSLSPSPLQFPLCICKYTCWCLTGLLSPVHFSIFFFSCSSEWIISVEVLSNSLTLLCLPKCAVKPPYQVFHLSCYTLQLQKFGMAPFYNLFIDNLYLFKHCWPTSFSSMFMVSFSSLCIFTIGRQFKMLQHSSAIKYELLSSPNFPLLTRFQSLTKGNSGF